MAKRKCCCILNALQTVLREFNINVDEVAKFLKCDTQTIQAALNGIVNVKTLSLLNKIKNLNELFTFNGSALTYTSFLDMLKDFQESLAVAPSELAALVGVAYPKLRKTLSGECKITFDLLVRLTKWLKSQKQRKRINTKPTRRAISATVIKDFIKLARYNMLKLLELSNVSIKELAFVLSMRAPTLYQIIIGKTPDPLAATTIFKLIRFNKDYYVPSAVKNTHDLAQLMKKVREGLGLDIDVIAQELAIPEVTIKKYESGATPKLTHLLRILRWLHDNDYADYISEDEGRVHSCNQN